MGDGPLWERFFTAVREQPHLPYVVVTADFQQLQPIDGGGLCQAYCARMVTVAGGKRRHVGSAQLEKSRKGAGAPSLPCGRSAPSGAPK